MRAVLLHPVGERRLARRARRARRSAAGSLPARMPDLAVRRARAAGGPTDLANYTCRCGCQFEAAVTTTVACPHCGEQQAW